MNRKAKELLEEAIGAATASLQSGARLIKTMENSTLPWTVTTSVSYEVELARHRMRVDHLQTLEELRNAL